MANVIEVKVPDIGDFKDVPIIDVLVRPGDRVKTEDPLITLESDKASMDVPSPFDGVIKELKVKVGDKVSEGSLILIAEAESAPAGVVVLYELCIVRKKRAIRREILAGAPDVGQCSFLGDEGIFSNGRVQIGVHFREQGFVRVGIGHAVGHRDGGSQG